MRDFRKIKAWQLADDFAVTVYAVTREKSPSDERYGLTSQIRRAVVSVAANIAEGSKRRYTKEYLRFLDTAYGSLAEVEYYLHLARRLAYLGGDEYAALSRHRLEVGRTLYGLMQSVRKQAED